MSFCRSCSAWMNGTKWACRGNGNLSYWPEEHSLSFELKQSHDDSDEHLILLLLHPGSTATTAPFEKLYNGTEQCGALEGPLRVYQGRCEVFLYDNKVLDRLSMVTIELQDHTPDIRADIPVDKRIRNPHPVWNTETSSLPAITATHLHNVHRTARKNLQVPVNRA